VLVGIAAEVANRSIFTAGSVYSVCLVMMLGCSAAYNLARNSPRREALRRLDHAAIFLMIAGSYTPFTACLLHGLWAIGTTTAVWVGSIIGAFMKLVSRRRYARVSIVAYLALGWIVLVVAARPIFASLDLRTAILLSVGGVLYSVGVGFFLWRSLPFHNAIWHGLVLVAAGCHYVAVLYGVVLAES
jgi:hemolysin III